MVLLLDRVCQRYNQSPHAYVFGDAQAYQFDCGVARLGAHADAKADEWIGEGKKRRRKYTMVQIIDDLNDRVARAFPDARRPATADAKPVFADPRNLIKAGVMKPLDSEDT